MKNFNRRAAMAMLFLSALLISGSLGRELTREDWAKLKKGEIVKEVRREGGTQSGSWSVKVFRHPPERMWKAICSLELYDKYMARTTVSVLLDEAVKDKAVADPSLSADELEKFFADMKPGYRRHHPDGTWTVYSYQRNALPWPVGDRWVLLEITHDDKRMIQTWRRLAGNIKEDYGSWKLTPLEDGFTLGECEIHLDLAIEATGPFVAFAMEVSLPETYRAFEAMARDFEKAEKSKPSHP